MRRSVPNILIRVIGLLLVAPLSQFVLSTIARSQQIFIVCHGEYESTCKQHPYTVFEHCGKDNGVGGANPKVSGRNFCGNDSFDYTPAQGGSVGGNYCGYSWFRITCK
jgi:hypothetical protein